MNFRDLLDPVARTARVRGVLVVSRDDGLVVAETLPAELNGAAAAALAASLAGRVRRMAEVLGQPEPILLELQGNEGILLAAPAGEGLLLVAVAGRGTDTATLQRRLLDAAGRTG